MSASIAPAAMAPELVAARLRELIFSGALPGGTPVREQDLAERLGVSRTPVREAVGALVAEGLLTKDGHRTAHVFRPSLTELAEIYEIRVPLESLAARLACASRDSAFLTRLRATHAELARAEPGPEWSARHEAFHLALVHGSGRPRLEGLVRTLRLQSEPYVRFAVITDAGLRRRAERDHADMLAGAQAGDATGLERLVKRHLTATQRHVAQSLSRAHPPAVAGFVLPALDRSR